MQRSSRAGPHMCTAEKVDTFPSPEVFTDCCLHCHSIFKKSKTLGLSQSLWLQGPRCQCVTGTVGFVILFPGMMSHCQFQPPDK